jgi:acid phosphatase (class A)
MRRFMIALAFVALTAFSPALLHAEDAKPYSDNKEINLLALLPPPPALDSARMKPSWARS